MLCCPHPQIPDRRPTVGIGLLLSSPQASPKGGAGRSFSGHLPASLTLPPNPTDLEGEVRFSKLTMLLIHSECTNEHVSTRKAPRPVILPTVKWKSHSYVVLSAHLSRFLFVSEKDVHRRKRNTHTNATFERAAGSAAGHVRAVTLSSVAGIAILCL